MNTKEGIFDKKEKLKNTHYHTKEKGCKLVPYEKRINGTNRFFKAQKCLTHNKIVCRCGWEFGWHYGTNNRKLLKKQKAFFNINNPKQEKNKRIVEVIKEWDIKTKKYRSVYVDDNGNKWYYENKMFIHT